MAGACSIIVLPQMTVNDAYDAIIQNRAESAITLYFVLTPDGFHVPGRDEEIEDMYERFRQHRIENDAHFEESDFESCGTYQIQFLNSSEIRDKVALMNMMWNLRVVLEEDLGYGEMLPLPFRNNQK